MPVTREDQLGEQRTRALGLPGQSVHPSPSSGDVEALVCATVYVGDQLARIAEQIECVKHVLDDGMKIGGPLDLRDIVRGWEGR